MILLYGRRHLNRRYHTDVLARKTDLSEITSAEQSGKTSKNKKDVLFIIHDETFHQTGIIYISLFTKCLVQVILQKSSIILYLVHE